jgi:2-dehydro-3-deoxygluconokinase
MLELSTSDQSLYRLGFGGDTLNTAIYLARAGGSVDYVTALGDDPFSAQMINSWQDELVGTSLVKRKPNSLPGLYMIQTDSRGERSFSYWRQAAPARSLIEDWPDIFTQLMAYNFLYLSGITLSLYSDDALGQLWQFLADYRRQGGKVVFDINYRPASWPDQTRTLDVFGQMLQLTDIALPSFDDEKLLYGEHTREQCLARYLAAGTTEVVIKDGINGCFVYSQGEQQLVPVAKKITPVDTTAAGDSFNGAYLAARLAGEPVLNAVRAGQACAALVIQHRGAIIPRHLQATANNLSQEQQNA